MGLTELFLGNQPLLFSIAYRMTGTVSDAEDILQDVYLHAREKDVENLDNPRAYLCKMVTNHSLDFLKSARKKREVYIGPWLPEPLIIQENHPYSELIKEESISFALLVLLEKLNPIERAVFILREVLDYNYSAIAEIVGKNANNCRKIFSRVKDKLPPLSLENTGIPNESHETIIHTFISALNNGNIQQIEDLLARDVVLFSDGGGKVYAALKPVVSSKLVLRFITNLLQQYNQTTTYTDPTLKLVNINGQTGLLTIDQNHIKTVICFQVDNQQMKEIYIVRNPEKLKHVKEITN
ncbi:RNA polymerase sigma-70 factor [Neobacillus sp. D3-1R]|uniref:RNA polymerase sigma-70 factor n=1 Tax=Neobacillus sp. D3-1R TaxID=3445778 RepID=UPI003FA109E0